MLFLHKQGQVSTQVALMQQENAQQKQTKQANKLINAYLYNSKNPGIMEKSGLEGVFLNPVTEPVKKIFTITWGSELAKSFPTGSALPHSHFLF